MLSGNFLGLKANAGDEWKLITCIWKVRRAGGQTIDQRTNACGRASSKFEIDVRSGYGSIMSFLAVVRFARALLASVILPLGLFMLPAFWALPRALTNSF